MLVVDYFSLTAHVIPSVMAIIYNVAAVLAGVFLKTHWRIGLYAVLLMTAFNFFSHGTQDLYPTFLQQQHFSTTTVSTIAVIYNIGAILGSLTFGTLSGAFRPAARHRHSNDALASDHPLVGVWRITIVVRRGPRS